MNTRYFISVLQVCIYKPKARSPNKESCCATLSQEWQQRGITCRSSHCAHCVSDNTSFNATQAAALASRSPPHRGQKTQSRGGTQPFLLCSVKEGPLFNWIWADLTQSFLNWFLPVLKKGWKRRGRKKNPNKPHREVGSSAFMHVRTKPACPWARRSCAGTTPAPQVWARWKMFKRPTYRHD